MGATVVLVARDEARGADAVRELKELSGNSNVSVLMADLSSLVSIRQMANEFKATHDRLDVLINCAGAIYKERQLSPDNIELTFALNHLSYFFLTSELLDLLRASSPARIVNVASQAHKPNQIDFDDLEWQKRDYRGYEGDLFRPTAYGQAKLGNILFTKELARRLQGSGVTVNCLHPGFVNSNFGTNIPGLLTWLFKLTGPLRISPKKGAATVVYLATSPEVAEVSGEYFIKKKIVASSPASQDMVTARRLWDVSGRMIEEHMIEEHMIEQASATANEASNATNGASMGASNQVSR